MTMNKNSRTILPKVLITDSIHSTKGTNTDPTFFESFLWNVQISLVFKLCHQTHYLALHPISLIKGFLLKVVTKLKMLQTNVCGMQKHHGPRNCSLHLGDVSTGLACTQFRNPKVVHLYNTIYPLHSFNFLTYLSQLSTNVIHLIYLYYSKYVPFQHLLALGPAFQGPLIGFVTHLFFSLPVQFYIYDSSQNGCCCYRQMHQQEPNYTIGHLVLKLNETEQ